MMATCEMARRMALALPGAKEKDHFGRPSFRVGGKIFATLWPKEKRAVLKLPADHQTMLFEAQPEAFSPARWGSIVWTFVELPKVDKAQLDGLLAAAWRTAAPKALLRTAAPRPPARKKTPASAAKTTARR
jgi:hypothetical protein